MSLVELARPEREDLLTLLESLSSEEWRKASLCVGWSVRDVVAHMLSHQELGARQLAGRFLRGCRPLGRPRVIPDERLVPALWTALFAPVVRGVVQTRGVRLVGTDLDWAFDCSSGSAADPGLVAEPARESARSRTSLLPRVGTLP